MNTMIFLSILGLGVLTILIGFYLSKDRSKAIVPATIPMYRADEFTAQQVFDWVVYMIHLNGRQYIDVLYDPRSRKHEDLFEDLLDLYYVPDPSELLQRMHEIATKHRLKPDVIDAAY